LDTSHRLRESLDQGNTWTSLQAPIDVLAVAAATYQGAFQADSGFAAVTDKGANTYDPDTIYISDGTSIYVTKDHGLNWLNRSGPFNFFVQQIVVDPRNRDTAYVVNSNGPGMVGNRVFRTTDAGQTWLDITANLPDLPTWSMAVDPRSGALYVGTEMGVYASTDNGTTWQRFGVGMPNVQVTQLDLNQNLNILTAGTYGRSIYQFYLSDVPANSGGLRAVSGQSVWTGQVQLSGPTSLAAGGTQTIQNGLSAGQLTIVGTISDLVPGANNRLTKIGQGDVVLSGANTYGGVTEIKEGVLVVHNRQALGSPTNGTIVNLNTALELQSDLDLEPITLNGHGIAFNGHNTGALRNVSNNNTYTGTITLNSNSTI